MTSLLLGSARCVSLIACVALARLRQPAMCLNRLCLQSLTKVLSHRSLITDQDKISVRLSDSFLSHLLPPLKMSAIIVISVDIGPEIALRNAVSLITGEALRQDLSALCPEMALHLFLLLTEVAL